MRRRAKRDAGEVTGLIMKKRAATGDLSSRNARRASGTRLKAYTRGTLNTPICFAYYRYVRATRRDAIASVYWKLVEPFLDR